MFVLNEILGIGDFSIMDNLRLIVIAAIFIGIPVVLLYIKSAKSESKTERKKCKQLIHMIVAVKKKDMLLVL